MSLLLGDMTLELLEYKSPPSETTMPLASNNLGASHVGFLVDDIEAKKAELEAKGIEFFSAVNVVDEGVLAGWRWVYFTIRTAIRSSSSRSPTTTPRSGEPESRHISRRDRRRCRRVVGALPPAFTTCPPRCQISSAEARLIPSMTNAGLRIIASER